MGKTGSGSGAKRLAEAGRVVEQALEELPDAIRKVAKEIPVLLFEDMPPQLIEEGWDPDLLGLFEGIDMGEESDAGQARISLFLGNLWHFAEKDHQNFLEEVRITFLHELGHLLGMDEEDLDVRGLG